ncbi:hypothetical protein [Sediminibacterium ginsengisoli]|uniref:hypothetical protein n=1 Tax=Sediminibacterium ginsengisoli TaxID=413434 RepID=UPI00373FCF5B
MLHVIYSYDSYQTVVLSVVSDRGAVIISRQSESTGYKYASCPYWFERRESASCDN